MKAISRNVGIIIIYINWGKRIINKRYNFITHYLEELLAPYVKQYTALLNRYDVNMRLTTKYFSNRCINCEKYCTTTTGTLVNKHYLILYDTDLFSTHKKVMT